MSVVMPSAVVSEETSNEEMWEEEVLCSVCLNLLNDPIILDCAHNICLQCAHWLHITEQQDCIHCPQCRQPTLVPSKGVQNMRHNITLRNLVARLQVQRKNGSKSGTTTATAAGEFSDAVSTQSIKQMNSKLKNSPGRRNNQPSQAPLANSQQTLPTRPSSARLPNSFPISSTRPSSAGAAMLAADPNSSGKCSVHDIVWSMYCTLDECPLCLQCISCAPHKDHQDKVISLQDALDSAEGEIHSVQSKLAQCFENFKVAKSELEGQMHVVNMRRGQLREDVKTYFSRICSFVAERERLSLSQIDEDTNDALKSLATSYDSLSSTERKIASSSAVCERCLQEATKSQQTTTQSGRSAAVAALTFLAHFRRAFPALQEIVSHAECPPAPAYQPLRCQYSVDLSVLQDILNTVSCTAASNPPATGRVVPSGSSQTNSVTSSATLAASLPTTAQAAAVPPPPLPPPPPLQQPSLLNPPSHTGALSRGPATAPPPEPRRLTPSPPPSYSVSSSTVGPPTVSTAHNSPPLTHNVDLLEVEVQPLMEAPVIPNRPIPALISSPAPAAALSSSRGTTSDGIVLRSRGGGGGSFRGSHSGVTTNALATALFQSPNRDPPSSSNSQQQQQQQKHRTPERGGSGSGSSSTASSSSLSSGVGSSTLQDLANSTHVVNAPSSLLELRQAQDRHMHQQAQQQMQFLLQQQRWQQAQLQSQSELQGQIQAHLHAQQLQQARATTAASRSLSLPLPPTPPMPLMTSSQVNSTSTNTTSPSPPPSAHPVSAAVNATAIAAAVAAESAMAGPSTSAAARHRRFFFSRSRNK